MLFRAVTAAHAATHLFNFNATTNTATAAAVGWLVNGEWKSMGGGGGKGDFLALAM